jgi:glutamine amidotransferase
MSPAVAVLDHGMGNLRSVAKALEAAGADVEVTGETRAIERADALCVPGQGIFGRCVDALSAGGLDDLVRSWIVSDRPFLGICLGMQVLFESSEEDAISGLGIFEGHVRKLPDTVRVPHIGWNEVQPTGTGLVERQYFYFDHSFAVDPTEGTFVSGWCDHGRRFAASIETRSLLGVQFHPEKSGESGIRLLGRWLDTVTRRDDPTLERRA